MENSVCGWLDKIYRLSCNESILLSISAHIPVVVGRELLQKSNTTIPRRRYCVLVHERSSRIDRGWMVRIECRMITRYSGRIGWPVVNSGGVEAMADIVKLLGPFHDIDLFLWLASASRGAVTSLEMTLCYEVFLPRFREINTPDGECMGWERALLVYTRAERLEQLKRKRIQ